MIEDITRLRTLHVIATGGTIDMEGEDARRPGGKTEELIKAAKVFTPDMDVIHPFDEPLDSTNIGPEQWRRIIDRVWAIAKEKKGLIDVARSTIGERPYVAGIVITHGTDTLQETGLILSLEAALIEPPFPIVLTCSHSPAGEHDSDALRNFVFSCVAAQSYLVDKSTPITPGVYVLVGGDLHVASRIKKVTTLPTVDRSYIESIPAPAGRLTGAHKSNLLHLDVENQVRIRFLDPKISPKPLRELKERKFAFGYVEQLWFKKESPPVILGRALERCREAQSGTNPGRRAALVLHGDFSNKDDGGLHTIVELIQKAARQHVLTFTGSPNVYERLKDIGGGEVVHKIPKSMSHSVARTKLAWLLQFDFPVQKLPKLLRGNVAGECFEIASLPDWIAGESYGPNNPSDTKFAKRVVISFPGAETPIFDEAFSSLRASGVKKREINIVGFGDGNLPIGNLTLVEVTNRYLESEHPDLELILPHGATYLDVERELAQTLRYNTGLHRQVILRFRIDDKGLRLLVKELFDWYSSFKKEEKRLWVEKGREKIIPILPKYLNLPSDRIPGVMKANPVYFSLLLDSLYDMVPQKPEVHDFCKALRGHGVHYPFDELLRGIARDAAAEAGKGQKPKTTEERGQEHKARLVEDLAGWLQHLGNEDRLSVSRLVPHLLARRLVKEAVARAHPILRHVVEAVDDGIKVNILTNAEMSPTDTRKYELGTFLLVAGADSELAPGWPAGPFRRAAGAQPVTAS